MREDVLVFVYEDEEVAELHPPDEGAPRRTDRMVEWRLTFEAYAETTVLGTADCPPIDGALFYVDQALDYLENDE